MIEKQKPGKVLMLPVDAIEPSPWQARTDFDETEIAALAVSILQNGLLQPISVRRVGLRKYQLIAGERRLRACKLARLEKVPAILSDWSDSESAALGLLENIQRSQLDPFDTARGIREVIRLWGCTQAEAARRLGLSQPALANKLRLLSLTAAQQQLCIRHHLTERHARAVLRLPENRRTAALEKIARDSLSVRETDKLVETMLSAAPGTPSPCRKTTPMVRDVRLFVNTLQHAVDLMTQKGIPATTTCGRRDGCLEYVVRIPVESADTSLPLPQAKTGDRNTPRPIVPVGPPEEEPAAPQPDSDEPFSTEEPPSVENFSAPEPPLADQLSDPAAAPHAPVMPPPSQLPPGLETIAQAGGSPDLQRAQPGLPPLPGRAPSPDPDTATVASLTRQG